MEKQIVALLPLIYLGSALLIPIVAFRITKIANVLAMIASAAVAVLSVYGFLYVLQYGTISYHFGGWRPPLGIAYVYDPLSAFVAMVINVVACIVLVHSHLVVRNELDAKRMPYYSVIMLMMAGLNGMVVTGDMFNLFVFIEISSLSMYGLIAVGGKSAPLAAFRYVMIGTIGASFYLLGVGFIYFVTGTLNMADFAAILPHCKDNPAIHVALILMVTGLGIKMALFPMHGWLPDAYTTAPSTSSALIAPIGTKVGAYVLIRYLFFIYGVEFFKRDLMVGEIIAILSCCGILFGSIMAMAQKDLKRMLAYSSVAQIGYIGLGIGLGTRLGFIGAVLHVLNHAFMKGCLFVVAANLITKTGHATIPRFNELLSKHYPWTMAAFTVAALSMVGLPPLAGFFSKWYLALATIDAHRWAYLAVILVSSLLNAIYFFRIIEKVYMKDPTTPIEGTVARDEVKPSMLVPTLILALGVIVVGLFNWFIVAQIDKMMPSSL